MSAESKPLFEYTLRLADDALVLGHRLSEWCSRAPVLEEELAIANIALDCLGHAQVLLTLAAELEGSGRTADDLAFHRDAVEFRNVLLAELPSDGDFAFLIARQLLLDAFRFELYTGLITSTNAGLAAFGQKAVKEVRYHLRHSSSLTARLGDGTPDSHARMQQAFDRCWPYIEELFSLDPIEVELSAQGTVPNRAQLRSGWDKTVKAVLHQGGLIPPSVPGILAGPGSAGKHTEHLGHLLAEMQIVARSHPSAKW